MFSSIGISRSSSPQEKRERARKHRGKNIHSAGTSHLYHRLRRLQRKHRQEEKDRDQHQLPAFVVVFRISDDCLCARNYSVIIFARQLSGKRLHSCHFCKFNYLATVACICMQQWQNRLLVWASNRVGFEGSSLLFFFSRLFSFLVNFENI